ncbi:hypothetical protein QQP08_015529, partial [Theobroma cacao]
CPRQSPQSTTWWFLIVRFFFFLFSHIVKNLGLALLWRCKFEFPIRIWIQVSAYK